MSLAEKLLIDSLKSGPIFCKSADWPEVVLAGRAGWLQADRTGSDKQRYKQGRTYATQHMVVYKYNI